MKEKFLAYLSVQEIGAYNMFDPQARKFAGELCDEEITRQDWIYIINNYSELYKEYCK